MSHPLLCWDICLEGLQRRILLSKDIELMQKIIRKNQWHDLPVSPINTLIWENKVIIITDSKLNIISATENIVAMNGYSQDEVIGKSPKLFQGDKTEASARKLIKMAVNNEHKFESIITNYKKDGTIYKCHIEGYPVFNKQGNLVNFIALENVA